MARGAVSTTSARSRARVLLAEDDPAARALLAEVLRYDGYEVLIASDATGLLWLVETAPRRRPIDLVVFDLSMPSYNGLDLVERWSEVGARPRLLVLSAFLDPEARRREKCLGIDFLDKPFEIGRLRQRVREMVKAREGGCHERRAN